MARCSIRLRASASLTRHGSPSSSATPRSSTARHIPYLDAQPRRYRLRLLNGSQARFYNIGFDVNGTDLPFWVIDSEQGLFPKPAEMTSLLIAPGERFDVIVDFTGTIAGKHRHDDQRRQ